MENYGLVTITFHKQFRYPTFPRLTQYDALVLLLDMQPSEGYDGQQEHKKIGLMLFAILWTNADIFLTLDLKTPPLNL